MNKNKKYIVLKEGNNYPLIIALIIIVIVCVLLFTSKQWLPDTRPNMHTKVETQLIMNMNTVTVKDSYIDYSNQIGEIHFTQRKTSELDRYKLNFKVFDDKGNELPYSLILGNEEKENEQSSIIYQNGILQFGIYEGFYQVVIEVMQEDNLSEKINIDYRSIVEKPLVEKSQNYLLNIEEEEKKVQEEKITLEYKKEEKNRIEKELVELQDLKENERAERNDKLNVLNNEIPQLEEKIAIMEEEVAKLRD